MNSQQFKKETEFVVACPSCGANISLWKFVLTPHPRNLKCSSCNSVSEFNIPNRIVTWLMIMGVAIALAPMPIFFLFPSELLAGTVYLAIVTLAATIAGYFEAQYIQRNFELRKKDSC